MVAARARGLWSLHALYTASAPARGLSPTAHARSLACQQRPLTPSIRRVSRGADATALSLSREEAYHVRLRRARAALRNMLIGALHYSRPLRQLEASLHRCTAVLRHAGYGF